MPGIHKDFAKAMFFENFRYYYIHTTQLSDPIRIYWEIHIFILCKVVKHLTFSKDIQRYDKICGGSQWSFRDISALFKSLAKNCKKEVRRASTNSIRGTFTFPSQTMLILDIGLEGKFTFRFHTVVKSAVQSIKSKHQYFRFFWKKLSTSQF